MKIRIAPALFSLYALTAFCQNYTSPPVMTPAEKAYVLSRFCNEVKYNFAFYDRLEFDWDSLCIASLPELVNSKTDEDFVKGMQALCANLKDGHTYVTSLNNPANPADWIRPFPMKTKRIGDRVFVTDTYSSVLQAAGLTPGCEIIRIDGENVIDYARKNLVPFLSSSTPQWTKYSPFSGFDLTKDKGSKVSKIIFQDNKGKEHELESNRLIPWDLTREDQSIDLKILRGNVGLLTIRSFQEGEFDPKLFDRLYNEILMTDALIIDIRDNKGGNSSNADYLMSHFSNKSIPQGSWKSPMYVAAHGSWNYPREWYNEKDMPIQPVKNKEIYLKPIILLINASTFSSAENFCVSFKAAQRGKIIGTPTGGSTGNPIFLDLGFGIGCAICTKHELDDEGTEFVGIGLLPHIVVEETESVIFGNDNVIEKALKLIQE